MAAEPAIMEAVGAMEAAEAMEADLGNAPSTAAVPAIMEEEVAEDNEVATPAVEVDVLNGSAGAPMGAIPGKPGGFPPPRPANKELGPPIFGCSFLSNGPRKLPGGRCRGGPRLEASGLVIPWGSDPKKGWGRPGGGLRATPARFLSCKYRLSSSLLKLAGSFKGKLG